MTGTKAVIIGAAVVILGFMNVIPAASWGLVILGTILTVAGLFIKD